jgi:hypothetical protein
VEAQILYTAVFEDRKTKRYHPEILAGLPDLLPEHFPEMSGLEGVVRIVDVSGCGCTLYHDLRTERLAVTMGGADG